MERAEELIKQYDILAAQGQDLNTERWLLEVIDAYEKEYPDDISGRCALYNESGSFYRHRKKPEESICWFLRAKELMETPVCIAQSGCKCCYYTAELPDEVYGFKETVLDRTVNYANTINNLAGAYRMTGMFDEAVILFQKAIDIYEQDQNVPATFLCSALNNLALVFLDEGKEEEAISKLEKTLAILKKTNENHFEKATTYANMAIAYYRMGKYQDTEECLKKADVYYVSGKFENSEEYQAFLRLRELLKNEEWNE